MTRQPPMARERLSISRSARTRCPAALPLRFVFNSPWSSSAASLSFSSAWLSLTVDSGAFVATMQVSRGVREDSPVGPVAPVQQTRYSNAQGGAFCRAPENSLSVSDSPCSLCELRLATWRPEDDFRECLYGGILAFCITVEGRRACSRCPTSCGRTRSDTRSSSHAAWTACARSGDSFVTSRIFVVSSRPSGRLARVDARRS